MIVSINTVLKLTETSKNESFRKISIDMLDLGVLQILLDRFCDFSSKKFFLRVICRKSNPQQPLLGESLVQQ